MTNVVQRTCEALVAVLDANASVVALTGRTRLNVVPYAELVSALAERDGEAMLPLVGYTFVSGEQTGLAPGRWDRLVFQLTAAAVDSATVFELLGVIESELTALALSNLAVPLEAYIESRVRRGRDFDPDMAIHAADLDITLVAQQ